MPIGSIAKSTGTYSLPTGILPRIELNSYPGVTIGLSAANTFSAWNINAVYAGVGITCDVYGYSKL
jgi:hypothetical protein